MSDRTPYYPYGYRPIQQPKVSPSLPEGERRRAQTRRQNLKSMKSYKVLLIGESGVGKSTLVARLCEDRFMAESRQYTLGEESEKALSSQLSPTSSQHGSHSLAGDEMGRPSTQVQSRTVVYDVP